MSTLGVDRQLVGNAAVQHTVAKRQQSAKPRGNSKPRATEDSDSVSSSNSADSNGGNDDDDDDGNSNSDVSSQEGGEEEGKGDSQSSPAGSATKQKQVSKSSAKQRRSSSQQADDEYDDDSSVVGQSTAQSSKPVNVRGDAALQQPVQSSMTASAALANEGAESVLTVQQMSQQHVEHMHVAVRARPVPAGSSSSCWTVDPTTAVVTLNASQTAAKRKMTQYGQGALRSSNGNPNSGYLDGGLSRGLLGSAPSTPGNGTNAWDSSGTSATNIGYKFDQVLDEDAATAVVYASCIQGLVQSALEGINGTVLAYGKRAVSSQ